MNEIMDPDDIFYEFTTRLPRQGGSKADVSLFAYKYKLYFFFFYQLTIFFSHNKSANNIFSYDLANCRTTVCCNQTACF